MTEENFSREATPEPMREPTPESVPEPISESKLASGLVLPKENENTSGDEMKSGVQRESKSDTPNSSKNKSSPSASPMFSFLIFILIVLALGSVGASAYLFQQMQSLSKQTVQKENYNMIQAQQDKVFASLQDELDESKEALIKKGQTLDLLGQEVDQLNKKLASISGVNRVDWLTDELQHLTRLAHQRLILSKDAEGAIALLNAADKVVIEMRQTSALPIRQAIASDLINLRVAAEVDLEGAYIRLDALSNKIETLNFKHIKFPEKHVVLEQQQMDPEINANFEEKLISTLGQFLARLKASLYRIEVEGVNPPLAGDDRAYLGRNLQMALEEAQLALLRRESQSYLLSLQQSEKWISKYFDDSDPLTASTLKILRELQSYQLNPDIPDIDTTLNAVKEFSDRWQQEKLSKPKLKRKLGAKKGEISISIKNNNYQGLIS